MTLLSFTRSLLAAGALITFTGMVQADIVQCIDVDGAVTFTDRACHTAAETVQRADTPYALPLETPASPAAQYFAAAEAARASTWVIKPASQRSLALDVATLKAAKDSLTSIDVASALVRQQTRARL